MGYQVRSRRYLKGILIHELLGTIETEKDVDKVFFKICI